MPVHGVHSHAAMTNVMPLSTVLSRSKTENAPSDDVDSYSEFNNRSSNGTGANSDVIDRDAAIAGGHDATQPVPDPAPNANPLTQQAPDAEALVGVATYNFRGEIAPLHPGAGNSLRLVA
jgi:hypothetical protein